MGVCFLANAAGFTAVLLALRLIRTEQPRPAAVVERGPGQLTAGLRHMRATAGLWAPLAMMAPIGTLAYKFPVVLPLLARVGVHGDARTYGFMTSATGLGAVAGGLAVAARGRAGIVPLIGAAVGFAATLTAASARRLARDRQVPGTPGSGPNRPPTSTR